MLIVDVDSHYYESAHYGEFLQFMEDPVLRHLTAAVADAQGTTWCQGTTGAADQRQREAREFPLRPNCASTLIGSAKPSYLSCLPSTPNRKAGIAYPHSTAPIEADVQCR
jgi:hypothetical protein